MISIIIYQVLAIIISGLILFFFVMMHLFGPAISVIENGAIWVSVVVIIALSVAVFSIQLWVGENYDYVKLAKKLSVITVLISLLPFVVGFIEGKIGAIFLSKEMKESHSQTYEETKIDVAQRIKENRIYNGEEAILFVDVVRKTGTYLPEDFQGALNLMKEAIDAGALDLNLKAGRPSYFEGKSACDYYREVISETDKEEVRIKQEIRKAMSGVCNYQ